MGPLILVFFAEIQVYLIQYMKYTQFVPECKVLGQKQLEKMPNTKSTMFFLLPVLQIPVLTTLSGKILALPAEIKTIFCINERGV